MSAQPGHDITRREPARELVARVRSDEFQQQVALALPENVRPERFVRVMATALIGNPDLASRAEPDSIFQAGLRAAQDGLFPDGREAAFVLFGNKATYMPMIGGLRKIAAEHGWTLRTAVVHEHDEFDYELGLDAHLAHRPPRPGVARGNPIAAYAIATHRDGRHEFEVMSASEIERVRQASRAKNTGPWVDWWDRMWEKTVGRRLFAKLPLDPGDVRVARLAKDEDPVTLIYGREARLARAAVTGSPPDPQSPAGEAPNPGGVPRQQAGETDTPSGADTPSGGDDGTVSPATGTNDDESDEPVEGEIVDEGQTQLVPPDPEIVAAAAGQVIPGGQHKGKTVAQVFAYDPEYLKSGAVKRLQGAEDALVQAVDIYLAAQDA